MNKSFQTIKLIGALALGTLAGAGLGVLFAINKEYNIRTQIVSDTKNLVKNLSKKGSKKAKNMDQEEWLARE